MIIYYKYSNPYIQVSEVTLMNQVTLTAKLTMSASQVRAST